jgi:transcriptional regulator with GAF, ATPase, and Fis domain
MARTLRPVILVVDDLRDSYESLLRNLGGYDSGRLVAEFEFHHLTSYFELRDWYAKNRSRFVSLLVQDVDFSHVTDERKLIDYPEILKPLQRPYDLKSLQGFLIYGYLRQNNIDRIAPVIFVSSRVGMETTSEFSEFIVRPGYGTCSFVPESAVGDQFYPKIAASVDALALRPLSDEQRRNWIDHHKMVVGRARKMAYLVYEIERIGPSDAIVLLLGGPGVGKELVANALHRCSYRYKENDDLRSTPLTINMAALHKNLVEDELFGHERGAYSDAATQRAGIFEAAQGSSVFLDEIGDIDTDIQVKLLRAMENYTIKRLGSSRELEVDMRIIAATNRTIPDLQTRFRPDFYARLVQHCIPIPSLRERWEGEAPEILEADLEEMFGYIIEVMNRNPRHKRALRMEQTAVRFVRQMVEEYIDGTGTLFDGNIRTLRNVIERAYERAQYDGSEEIGLGHIMPALGMVRLLHSQAPAAPAPVAAQSGQPALPRTIESVAGTLDLSTIEQRALKEALQKTNNNQTQAAELLGIHRDTLRRKLADHNL